MKKLLLAALSLPLLITACDYQPWPSSSSEEEQKEKFDPTTIQYQYIELDREYTGTRLESFLETAYDNTKEAKKTDVVAYIMDIKEETGHQSEYNFEGYNIFYDNKVAESSMYFDEDFYIYNLEFLRDGAYYDYWHTVLDDDEGEDVDWGETSKTDLWDCFDFPMVSMVQEAVEDEDFHTGKYKGEIISICSELETYTTDINGETVDKKRQEQTIITYVDNRVSTVTYYYKTSVKYDFEDMEPSNRYTTFSIQQLYMEFDYDTEVGSFDEAKLQDIMDMAE